MPALDGPMANHDAGELRVFIEHGCNDDARDLIEVVLTIGTHDLQRLQC